MSNIDFFNRQFLISLKCKKPERVIVKNDYPSHLYDSECKSWMDVQLHILEVMFPYVTNFSSFLWLRMKIINGSVAAFFWNNSHFYVITLLCFEWLRMRMMTGRVTAYSWNNFHLYNYLPYVCIIRNANNFNFNMCMLRFQQFTKLISTDIQVYNFCRNFKREIVSSDEFHLL